MLINGPHHRQQHCRLQPGPVGAAQAVAEGVRQQIGGLPQPIVRAFLIKNEIPGPVDVSIPPHLVVGKIRPVHDDAGLIDRVEPVAVVMERMVSEAEALLGKVLPGLTRGN